MLCCSLILDYLCHKHPPICSFVSPRYVLALGANLLLDTCNNFIFAFRFLFVSPSSSAVHAILFLSSYLTDNLRYHILIYTDANALSNAKISCAISCTSEILRVKTQNLTINENDSELEEEIKISARNRLFCSDFLLIDNWNISLENANALKMRRVNFLKPTSTKFACSRSKICAMPLWFLFRWVLLRIVTRSSKWMIRLSGYVHRIS